MGCPLGPPPIGGPSSCTARTLKNKPTARRARHAQIPTRSFLEVSENILELLTRGSVTRGSLGSLRSGACGCQKRPGEGGGDHIGSRTNLSVNHTPASRLQYKLNVKGRRSCSYSPIHPRPANRLRLAGCHIRILLTDQNGRESGLPRAMRLHTGVGSK